MKVGYANYAKEVLVTIPVNATLFLTKKKKKKKIILKYCRGSSSQGKAYLKLF